MTLEIGKLYICTDHYLLVCESKSLFADGAYPALAAPVAHWNRSIDADRYCHPGTPFLVLSIDDDLVEVLTGEKKGWILQEYWMAFKELK